MSIPNLKGRKYRLRVVLPIQFFLLIAITAVAVIGLNYYSTTASIAGLAEMLVTQASENAIEQTSRRLEPAARVASLNAKLLDPSRFGDDFAGHFIRVTLEQMRLYPQFSSIYFGDNQGNFWLNERRRDGSISTQLITRTDSSPAANELLRQLSTAPLKSDDEKKYVAEQIAPYIKTRWIHRDSGGQETGREEAPYFIYDPRWRPWYEGAVARQEVFWTDVYAWKDAVVYSDEYQVGITASIPVVVDGNVAGVVGIDIFLNEISQLLNGLKITPNGKAFIFEQGGEIVGLPTIADAYRVDPKGEGVTLNRVVEVSDRRIVEAYQALLGQLGLNEGNPVVLVEQRLLRFISGGEQWYGFFKPFAVKEGLPWIIGIVTPEDDFLALTKKYILLSAIISLIGILVVILVSMRISRRITEPLDFLSAEANRVRKLELDRPVELVSAFAEIDAMSDSFNNMKAGLRSFKKFVPPELLTQMIASGREAELGAERRVVTTLFSDIANFTTMSEAMKPELLISHLGQYLSEMSAIIGNHQGTVDKYIGDAIMAFWNAPLELSDHAVRACHAALEYQSELAILREKWKLKNLPPISSRIGINTGEVLVGNMGSVQRFNYTVIGDPVNLAARLEALCKQYNAEIIISEYTYQAARDHIEARLLDYVTVKGKTQGVFVYELLGKRGETPPEVMEFIKSYEQGLRDYMDRNWSKALWMFETANKMRGGNDPAARKFIELCYQYEREPPPDDWRRALTINHSR